MEVSADGAWVKVTKGALTGWSSKKFLELVATPAPAKTEYTTPAAAPAAFPWWSIAKVELDRGVQEIPGSAQNERILEYLRSTTVDHELAKEDETPWCSAFANWCVTQAKYKGTSSAWAKSWLTWGKAADPKGELRQGSIVVLTRGTENGHVAFLDKVERDASGAPTKFHLLGGNQSDRVKISSYPASLLLGIRVPST